MRRRPTLNAESASLAVLVLLLATTAVLLWATLRGQYFVYDEFDYLRPPPGTTWAAWLISPHNEHTIVFTKLWFSVLYRVIGLQAYALYAAPMALAHLAGGVAVYKLLRLMVASRVLALAATAPVLLMAAGVGTLTWAGQFQYTGATAAGLWLLYIAVAPGSGTRSQWVWMIALSVFGTLSGSAFIPLAVAAGLAALSLRQHRLGSVVILIPAVWFALARLLWVIPSGNNAHSLAQVLQDGPEFVVALLGKAVDDSVPVGESFTAAILVVATIAAIAHLASPAGRSGIVSERARRTFLLLLSALVISLAMTLVGRLSRDLAESASGGYSYFILILAIPLFVVSLTRVVSGTRIATTLTVLLLAGWSATGAAAFVHHAQGLAEWKSSTATLLIGAAYLQAHGFAGDPDARPAPLAPAISWADLREMVDDGRISAQEPAAATADQISLAVQWTAAAGDGSRRLTDCSIVPAHTSTPVPGGSTSSLTAVSGAASVLTLGYAGSGASRSLSTPPEGLFVSSVSDRPATLTADSDLRLCPIRGW